MSECNHEGSARPQSELLQKWAPVERLLFKGENNPPRRDRQTDREGGREEGGRTRTDEATEKREKTQLAVSIFTVCSAPTLLRLEDNPLRFKMTASQLPHMSPSSSSSSSSSSDHVVCIESDKTNFPLLHSLEQLTRQVQANPPPLPVINKNRQGG